MRDSFWVAVVAVALAIAAPVRAQQSPASTTQPSAPPAPSPHGAHMHHHAVHHHRHGVHHAAARESTADQLNRQELAHLDVGGTPRLTMPEGGKAISK
jgi:hypothetical protein